MYKVLIIGTTYLYGGVGHLMFDLCKHIDSKKVLFDFLYYEDATTEEKQLIKEMGGKFFIVPRYSRHPASFLKSIFKFYRDNQYDCVHCYASTAMLIVYTLPLWKKKDVRIIYHSNLDYVPGKFTQFLHYFMRLLVVKKTDVRLAVSRKAAIFMYGKEVACQEKYILLKNGINIKKYSYNREVREEMRNQLDLADKFVIGNVGRISTQKNHKFILDTFSQVHKIKCNAVLLLVGDGELEEEMRRYVKEIKLEDSVIFLGAIPDVPLILQAMDVFFFPSLWEGLGIAAIEAQAAGLPVVASTEVPEEAAITSNFYYMDLQKDTKDTWVKKLLSLSENKERLSNDKCLIRAGYDIVESAKKLESIYTGSTS